MAKSVMGRPTIFKGKKGDRYQGAVTKIGSAKFEAARTRLAKLAGMKTASDGDTIEYLSRGHAATVAYLKGRK